MPPDVLVIYSAIPFYGIKDRWNSHASFCQRHCLQPLKEAIRCPSKFDQFFLSFFVFTDLFFL